MYSAQRHLTPWFSAMMDGELMFAESELPQPLVMYTASLPTFLYATKSVKYCLPVALSFVVEALTDVRALIAGESRGNIGVVVVLFERDNAGAVQGHWCSLLYRKVLRRQFSVTD